MSKKVLFPYALNTAQSLAADFVTAATIVDFTDNIGYQINVTTSDSTGAFTLQGSLDGISYATMLACGTVAAANDTIIINANQVPFKYIRLSYTAATPGTGTCTIFMAAKSVGA